MLKERVVYKWIYKWSFKQDHVLADKTLNHGKQNHTNLFHHRVAEFTMLVLLLNLIMR